MHRNKHLLFTSLFLLWNSMNLSAQQGNVAAGGEATGTGGNMSFSVGQTDYLCYSNQNGSLNPR